MLAPGAAEVDFLLHQVEHGGEPLALVGAVGALPIAAEMTLRDLVERNEADVARC
jgi:hypothetical protein